MNLSTLTGVSLPEVVAELQKMIARINTVFGREHHADGTHAIPQYFRLQSTELGVDQFPNVSNQTWLSQTVTTFAGWKHGDAMHIDLEIPTGTLGGTPSNHVSIQIPYGFTARESIRAPALLLDNGGVVLGQMLVMANSRTIDVYRYDSATLTAGTVGVWGQLDFRTTA